jgi:ribose 5-phosphate isomerase A
MTQDNSKLNAARKAMEWVRDGMVIGLGTGSTANNFIQELGNQIQQKGMKISAVASSYSSSLLSRKVNINPVSFDSVAAIDLYVDGADEVDPKKNLIKGRGGAMVQEKLLAESAKIFLVVVDESKIVPELGVHASVPVEVLPVAYSSVSRRLTSLGGTPVLRMAQQKFGPLITDQGNYVLDVKFQSGADFPSLDSAINNIPGVLGHGIFINLATMVIVGKKDGVQVLE